MRREDPRAPYPVRTIAPRSVLRPPMPWLDVRRPTCATSWMRWPRYTPGLEMLGMGGVASLTLPQLDGMLEGNQMSLRHLGIGRSARPACAPPCALRTSAHSLATLTLAFTSPLATPVHVHRCEALNGHTTFLTLADSLCPNLTALNAHKVPNVSVDALAAILACCPRLMILARSPRLHPSSTSRQRRGDPADAGGPRGGRG